MKDVLILIWPIVLIVVIGAGILLLPDKKEKKESKIPEVKKEEKPVTPPENPKPRAKRTVNKNK